MQNLKKRGKVMMMRRLVSMVCVGLLLAGCSGPGLGGAAAATAQQGTKVAAGFMLTSTAFTDGGTLPEAYTCDGVGISPPLEWHKVPEGTQSLAIVMHHVPGPGDVHVYWVAYNIPVSMTHVAAGATGIGDLGINTVNSTLAYAPPCSKGPGVKWYTVTVYALSAPPVVYGTVTRGMLLAGMSERMLAEATLTVSYDRTGKVDEPPPPPGP